MLMNLFFVMIASTVSIGKDAPENVNSIIEIPAYSSVKYEIDKDSGAIFVDRFLNVSMSYPHNYGYIAQTLAEDGDPLDILVITRTPVVPGSVIKSRPIGVLIMEDEKGLDEKIIAVPSDKIDPFYKNIKDIQDLDESYLKEIKHFFERYKDLEEGKWVKVKDFKNAKEAKALIGKYTIKKTEKKSK